MTRLSDIKIENLTDLANFLRTIPKTGLPTADDDGGGEVIGFDMCLDAGSRSISRHSCGSACCIGGWVGILCPRLEEMSLDYRIVSLSGDTISCGEAYRLCYPSGFGPAWDATPAQAARAVEILRDTGRCNWERAMSEA